MSEKDGNVKNCELPECFVLMPISDQEGYKQGHFKRVYEQIFKPACEKAGFKPVRADDVKQTNLIHLDILQKLLDAPMAICDLSTRNPNALFELGIRQAFDKPIVLVQEVGTKSIFDIAPIRYTEYRNDLYYEEVLQDQESIAKAIIETDKEFKSGQGVNSIVKLLSLTKSATLPDTTDVSKDPLLQVVMAEIKSLRKDLTLISNAAKVTIEDRTVTEKRKTDERISHERIILRHDLLRIQESLSDLVTSDGELNEELLVRLKQIIARATLRARRYPDLAEESLLKLASYESEIRKIENSFVVSTTDDDDIPF